MTRRGNQAAFEALVQRYEPRLLAFCRHMLGSREDAEDVLQESFAAAFNAILADERPINVRPWLYRIARNRSLNHLRRTTAIGVDSMDVYLADHGQSVFERILQRESFDALVADIGQLAETQRTALLLREMDAFSYEQIAHVMDTTVPSVKSLLVRARVSLAEAAEARKLSCEEVRLELGEVAEGLVKISPPVRRHVRDCPRCQSFSKQLKRNERTLAAMAPFGLPVLLHKLLAAKLGSTSAGGAYAATSTTASAGAGASLAAGAGATAAGGIGGLGGLGGLAGIGGSAIAAKAVAGLAAAALVTAVAVGHGPNRAHHSSAPTPAIAFYHGPASLPAVVASEPQAQIATRSFRVHAHGALRGSSVAPKRHGLLHQTGAIDGATAASPVTAVVPAVEAKTAADTHGALQAQAPEPAAAASSASGPSAGAVTVQPPTSTTTAPPVAVDTETVTVTTESLSTAQGPTGGSEAVATESPVVPTGGTAAPSVTG
jgi:RNA polymerase sigma factor (sigma-70 family)